MAMNTPNRSNATVNAPDGTARPRSAARNASTNEGRSAGAGAGATAGAASAAVAPICTPTLMFAAARGSVGLADDAFDQVVHLFQRDVGLLLLGAGGDHDLAGVVLQRALVDDHRPGHELRLRVVGLLLRLRR